MYGHHWGPKSKVWKSEKIDFFEMIFLEFLDIIGV